MQGLRSGISLIPCYLFLPLYFTCMFVLIIHEVISVDIWSYIALY